MAETRSNCGGSKAYGRVTMEYDTGAGIVQGGSFVTLHTFETPDDAKAAKKAAVAAFRAEEGSAGGLKIETSAEESEGFTSGGEHTGFLRVGGILVHIYVSGPESQELQKISKIQIDRIARVVNGENPDL